MRTLRTGIRKQRLRQLPAQVPPVPGRGPRASILVDTAVRVDTCFSSPTVWRPRMDELWIPRVAGCRAGGAAVRIADLPMERRAGEAPARWLTRRPPGPAMRCCLTPTPVTAPARLLCSATGRAAGLKVGRQPPASRRTSGCEYPTVRAGAVFRRPQLQLASPVFSSPERATTHLSSSGPPARQRSPSRKAPMTPATFSGSSSRNRCPPPLTT